MGNFCNRYIWKNRKIKWSIWNVQRYEISKVCEGLWLRATLFWRFGEPWGFSWLDFSGNDCEILKKCWVEVVIDFEKVMLLIFLGRDHCIETNFHVGQTMDIKMKKISIKESYIIVYEANTRPRNVLCDRFWRHEIGRVILVICSSILGVGWVGGG